MSTASDARPGCPGEDFLHLSARVGRSGWGRRSLWCCDRWGGMRGPHACVVVVRGTLEHGGWTASCALWEMLGWASVAACAHVTCHRAAWSVSFFRHHACHMASLGLWPASFDACVTLARLAPVLAGPTAAADLVSMSTCPYRACCGWVAQAVSWLPVLTHTACLH
jgi:hypothetical protein